jgi:transcriptional regulator with XRE-family HTH domain
VDPPQVLKETIVVIGNRLKELRESKQLSQGDIEKRTGLFRCYISRVENGHTVPSVSTLERMARALEVPMYRLFHDGEVPAGLSKPKPAKDDEFGSKGGEAAYASKLRRLLAKMKPADQNLLLHMAQKIGRDSNRSAD